jgi:hypothetical protein
MPAGESGATALSEFVSLAKALLFNKAAPPAIGKGTAFFDPELLRLLSKLFERVLLIPSILEILSRFLPLTLIGRDWILAVASTLLEATVDLPIPGVDGAPGLSSCASIRYHRKPSDSWNGLSFSSSLVDSESVAG